MRKWDRKLFVLSFCLLIGYISQLPVGLTAREFNLGVSYDFIYSDNIFMNASQVGDYISQFQVDLSLSKNRLNLYMDTAMDILSDNTEFNSFNLAAGIEYLLPLKGRNGIYFNLSYSILNYKDLYTDFNTNGPLIQAGTKLYISDQTLLKAGILFQSKNYTNFGSFDFISYNAFLEFKQFYKSQTNIRLQTGLNYRYYPHILTTYNFGNNYNYFSNRGSYGKNNTRIHTGPPDPKQQYTTMRMPSLSGLVAINQGIRTKLGITGEAELRKNLGSFDYNRAEILIKNTYILYPLNDDYLWDGIRLSIQCKMVLFNRLALSVEGRVSYFHKNYPGIFILDEEGNPVEPNLERDDSLMLYMLRITKKIGKFDFFTYFSHRNNHSNDGYFDYKMLTISAGIGYYF